MRKSRAGTVLLAGERNQLLERRQVLLRQQQLAGVGARVRIDRDRLAPEQLCAAAGKPAPPAERQLVGRAVERAVAPFHRMDREAVADRAAADRGAASATS